MGELSTCEFEKLLIQNKASFFRIKIVIRKSKDWGYQALNVSVFLIIKVINPYHYLNKKQPEPISWK